MVRSADTYDESYFNKWYRDPSSRVSTQAGTERKAAVVLATAEYYLERKVKTVLDVGCGEGQWQPILTHLRPGVKYLGVDSSKYAIERFGKERNLRLGAFGDLAAMRLARTYDLIVCSDLLYYLPRKDLLRGLGTLAGHLGGVAFLEAYATADAVEGDIHALDKRSATFYRRLFRQYGLISCGTHCYVGKKLAGRVTQLERGGV